MKDIDVTIPSFEEFVKHREKYLAREDENFGHIDKGSSQLQSYVQRHIYEIDGYRTRHLEEVERIAHGEGYRLSELKYQPELLPLSGRKCNILVRFITPAMQAKRALW